MVNLLVSAEEFRVHIRGASGDVTRRVNERNLTGGTRSAVGERLLVSQNFDSQIWVDDSLRVGRRCQGPK